mmetsp:Transcript_28970/g.43759  ORF Transcript_28970/g.43759 Transcript_28970/m.43759 type:complete len:845 (-) Transcript_28970:1322-3856(-)
MKKNSLKTSDETMDQTSRPEQVAYEILGSPSLLYRHDYSYEGIVERDDDLEKEKVENEKFAIRWQRDVSKLHRLKARFYDSMGRLSKDLHSKEEVVTLKELPIYDTDSSISFYKSSQLGRTRKRMFPDNPVVPIASQEFDQNLNFPSTQKIGNVLRSEEIRAAKRYAIERTNAYPEYLAPIASSSLSWAMEEAQSKRVKKPSAKHVTVNLKAKDFGNCLASFVCVCCKKTKCLMHPTGDFLSIVCLSTVSFLNDKVRRASQYFNTNQEINIGERILQIKQCNNWSNDRRCWFALRTPTFTALIQIQSVSSRCDYNMNLVYKTDLVTEQTSLPKFRPCDIAVYHGYGGSFTNPLFAISSVSEENGDKRSIHLGVNGDYCHIINNLQNIDQIEFSTHHPMILHAAATSFVRPSLVPNFMHKRTSLSHGSALYTIDLRSNQGAFQWSPSAEVFAIEGVCSISGMLPSWIDEHQLFVASTSASKLWKIDTRMPYKSVISWSLPGFYSDAGVNTLNNLYGDGTLLHRPNEYFISKRLCPIISVEKTPLTSVFSLYQEPLVSPRFQTNSLELSHGPGLNGASIVRGSIFPLLDFSPKISICGLASFRTEVSRIITHDQYQDLEDLGQLSMALGVITMTTKGDMYTHVLLEKCPASGLPINRTMKLGVASRSIKLSPESIDSKETRQINNKMKRGGFDFLLKLSNSPPLCSSQILSANVETRADVAPFSTVDRKYFKAMLAKGGRETEQLFDNPKVRKTKKREKELSSKYHLEDSCPPEESGLGDFLESDDNEHDHYNIDWSGNMESDLVSLANQVWVSADYDLERGDQVGTSLPHEEDQDSFSNYNVGSI